MLLAHQNMLSWWRGGCDSHTRISLWRGLPYTHKKKGQLHDKNHSDDTDIRWQDIWKKHTSLVLNKLYGVLQKLLRKCYSHMVVLKTIKLIVLTTQQSSSHEKTNCSSKSTNNTLLGCSRSRTLWQNGRLEKCWKYIMLHFKSNIIIWVHKWVKIYLCNFAS